LARWHDGNGRDRTAAVVHARTKSSAKRPSTGGA
jgi:hypothetical protein